MRPIAIVGAGPAGLTAAIAAGQRGLPVIVYEQSSALPQIGAGFLIHSNGLRVLRKLGLFDDIKELVQLTKQIVTDRSDGTQIMELDYSRLPIPENHGAVILREDLRRVLFNAARYHGPINFDHRCRSLETDGSNVRLQFDNGFEAEHSVVLACDGVNSRLRQLAGWNARVIPADYVTFAGISNRSGTSDCAREVWTSKGQYAGICPLPDGRSFFYAKGYRTSSSDFSLDKWLNDWKIEDPGVHAVLAGSNLSNLVKTEFRQIYVDSWSRSGVFLLGDAAHAMRPNLGQGANSSMVDALILIELLAKYYDRPADLNRIGLQYQEIRQPFVSLIQRFSKLIDVVRNLRSHSAQMIRDRLLMMSSQFKCTEEFVMSLIAGYNPKENIFFD